ncbi:MAG: 6,7-dimethyl-8-ribityllumazine synthase [Candidatus Hamiltonella defensa (Ceratovacuna japonica)]|uniref:6,7-dimethyl-8-ribityllumazine synthase n=1 Tax=Hamiltonella defensa subsp. Acyrthosiphon pisum (strain 5AT) TaxID=572265 RepID=C4K7H5_HAMD5|nr:riboflavin synthase, alpha chain [Candidatus Hamiltonella defensa 5AT (Acyrthosiphon pisum)]
MNKIKIIKGTLVAPNAKIAIAIARFNRFINDSLLSGALDALQRIGQIPEENITVVWVPGAYELPLIVKTLIQTKNYQAVVALGTVIRGSTTHFNYVAGECSAGLSQIAISTDTPVAFGVLTTENIEQAIERAGTKAGNKGADAAIAALEMINLIQTINLNHSTNI